MTAENKTTTNFLFFLSLLFAIWFLCTGSVWVYFINVFLSFPIGGLSLFLWYKGKQKEPYHKRWKIIPYFLIAGALLSVGFLVGLLITN